MYILILSQKGIYRTKNINTIKGETVQLKYFWVNATSTVLGTSAEWWSPNNAQSEVPLPSDNFLTTPNVDAQHSYSALTAELDALTAELDALLIADADKPNSALQNASILLTELGSSTVVGNGHLKNCETVEDSYAGTYVQQKVPESTILEITFIDRPKAIVIVLLACLLKVSCMLSLKLQLCRLMQCQQ